MNVGTRSCRPVSPVRAAEAEQNKPRTQAVRGFALLGLISLL